MNTQKVFDALLVLQYRSGDKRALGLLVGRYQPKLCRHAYSYTRDLDVSKDIVQDAWDIIINKLSRLKDPNMFGSWAMRIVTRKSLDFLKRESVEREKLKVYGMTSFEDVLPSEERISDINKLKKAIQLLPENQQTVLRLFYTQEYSLKEISNILETSEGTIKSRLFHAREKLKIVLKH